jgi:hypothetical protein
MTVDIHQLRARLTGMRPSGTLRIFGDCVDRAPAATIRARLAYRRSGGDAP